MQEQGQAVQTDDTASSKNPFRQAEKLYMLHKPPCTAKRRGKRTQQEAPALDLTSVIDLHCSADAQQWMQQGVVRQHQVPNFTLHPEQLSSSSNISVQEAATAQGQVQGKCTGVGQQQCVELVKGYTLPMRPGLLIIPSAVSPAAQLALAKAALTEYPEPPARTNHDTEYGPLTGVWAAAQQELLLRVPKQQHKQHTQATEPYPHAAPDNSAQQQDQQGLDQQQHQQLHNQLTQQEVISNLEEVINSGTGLTKDNSNSCAPAGAYSAAANDCPTGNDMQMVRTFCDCWYSPDSVNSHANDSGVQTTTHGNHHNAVKAASMLRRMRWAVLGPHYDWTARKYLMHEPHRCLPSGLSQLAKHWGAVAHQLQPCNGAQQQQVQQPATDLDLKRPYASYEPDGALVNFYYEGDTLMGHVDDAECDLTQPLVTVSVGCSAIMLVGGVTKRDAPHALLLHSGDVVVLSGHARRCYHGVPRILTDKPLPGSLPDYVSGLPQAEVKNWTPFLQHLAKCRINVSIRVVT